MSFPCACSRANLYAQAGDALKRWRTRKDAQTTDSAAPAATPVPVVAAAPAGVLQGRLAPLVLDFAKLEPLAESMYQLRQSLADYNDGLAAVDPTDESLLRRLDLIRRQLEAVFGQRITFTGEPRPAAGSPLITGEVEVGVLAGEAAGVVAGTIRAGQVRGSAKADTVEPTGRLYGVKAGDIGGTPTNTP